MIPAYYINRDAATARRGYIEASAKDLQIGLTRFAAIDANTLSDREYRRWHSEADASYCLSKSEVCCFLSHLKLWEEIAKSDAPFTAIFEDDILMSSGLAMPVPGDW